MGPMHTRKREWNGQPFASMEEVADLLKELIDLVVAAGKSGLSSEVASVRYPEKQYRAMPLAEFRQLVPALSLDDATVFLEVRPGGLPIPVQLELNVWNRRDLGPSVDLEVSGEDEVAVNGVCVAVQERVEALFEKKHHAEEFAAEEAATAEPPAPEPTWKRVLNNQWTIQIGTGFILFGLGLLIGSR